MKLFAQKCRAISIVGDPDQGIYGWRSANASNMQQMRSDYGNVTVINLEENYRSSTCILKASLAVIEQDSSRFSKTLIGTKGRGFLPVLRILYDIHIEAKWIAREIKRVMALTGGMIKVKDVAILVRSSSMTRAIEAGLAAAGLRYRMVGGHKFFDREEIKDTLAYLRIIHSLKDSAALLRIINVPSRKIGKERVGVFLRDSEKKKRTVWESVEACVRGELRFSSTYSESAYSIQSGLANFAKCILSARQGLASKEIASISELIDFVRQGLEYDEHLMKKFGADGADRIANLEELKTFSKEVESVKNKDDLPEIGVLGAADEEETALSRFLGNIALMTDNRDGDDDHLTCVHTDYSI
jgi:ATP-dependent DNA helicase UvrD/PcrA